jgi:hypothetical protein
VTKRPQCAGKRKKKEPKELAMVPPKPNSLLATIERYAPCIHASIHPSHPIHGHPSNQPLQQVWDDHAL